MSFALTRRPEAVCVLRLSAIGDVCHALPVVRTLQRHWPATRLAWIVGQREAELLSGIGGVDLITFQKSRGPAALRGLRARLGTRRFDVLLHMQSALRASLASLCVRAPLRVGFDRERARDGQWLFTNRRIPAHPRQHVMDALFGFAEALGLTEGTLRWEIPIPEADRRWARETLGQERSWLVISPCASDARRDWRLDRYVAVADHAALTLGRPVLLTGGPSARERAAAAAIAQRSRASVVNVAGTTSLKQLLAILERAWALVAPDSGPVHMATATGTPVVGLYAASNPGRTGPYFSRAWTVDRYPDNVRHFLKREPEEVHWGRRIRDPRAMDAISVEDVAERLSVLTQHAR